MFVQEIRLYYITQLCWHVDDGQQVYFKCMSYTLCSPRAVFFRIIFINFFYIITWLNSNVSYFLTMKTFNKETYKNNCIFISVTQTLIYPLIYGKQHYNKS